MQAEKDAVIELQPLDQRLFFVEVLAECALRKSAALYSLVQRAAGIGVERASEDQIRLRCAEQFGCSDRVF